MADPENNEKPPKKPDAVDPPKDAPQEPVGQQSVADADRNRRLVGEDAELKMAADQKTREAEIKAQFEQALLKGVTAVAGIGAAFSMVGKLASASELLGLDKDGKPKRPGDAYVADAKRKPGDKAESVLPGDPSDRPTDQAVRQFRELVGRNMNFPAERQAIAGADRTLQANSKNLPEGQRNAYNAIGSALVRGDNAALEKAMKEYGKNPDDPNLKGAVEALNRDLKGSGLSLELQPGTKKDGDKEAGPASMKVKREGDDRTLTVDSSGKSQITNKDGQPVSADDSRAMLRDVSKAARKVQPSDVASPNRDGEVSFERFEEKKRQDNATSERRFDKRSDGMTVERKFAEGDGKGIVAEREFKGRLDGVSKEVQYGPNHPEGHIAKRTITNAEGKEIGSEVDKWQLNEKTGKKEQVTVRDVAIGGQSVNQVMYPDGRVVTTLKSAEAGADKRPFSRAEYNPGPPATVTAEKDGKKVDIKPDEAFARTPGGKEGIAADGSRQFTVTDDPRKVSVTEFAKNDPAGRKTETKYRPEVTGGLATATVMRDGTVESTGRDQKGEYKARSWNDPERGQLTQTQYGDGSVVTTDGAGKRIGTDDKPVSLGKSKDDRGRDVSLMSDGSTVTDLGEGKSITKFPDGNKDGKQTQLRDEKAGTTATVYKDRVETTYDKAPAGTGAEDPLKGAKKTVEYTDGPKKGSTRYEYADGNLAARTVNPSVKDGVREEREFRGKTGNNYERDIYRDGAKVLTEARGTDERGSYVSNKFPDSKGNQVEQKFYGNGTVRTDFEKDKKVPGTLSENYGTVIQEPGKPAVGVRWEDMGKNPPKTETIDAAKMKAVANIKGADGVERALNTDGSASRDTEKGRETTFPDGRTELVYKNPVTAKEAGLPDGPDSKAMVTKKTTYPLNDSQARTARFEFQAGTSGDKTATTLTRAVDGKPGGATHEFTGAKDGKILEREQNGKIVETRFSDGRFVLTPEKGEPSAGRSRPFDNKNGEKGTIDVDDRTGRVSAIRYSEGARAGQQHNFSYDDKGKLNGITLPDGRTIKPGEDGKWDPNVLNKELGFKLDPKDGNVNLRVTENGNFHSDNGKGISQYVMKDGGRVTFDMNSYSRTYEKDGKSQTDYWDGYSFRQAKSVKKEGDKTVVEFEPQAGRPVRMERDPKAEAMKVTFADKSSFEANWKEQRQTYTSPTGEKTHYFNTGKLDEKGKPLWLEGIKDEKTGDISFVTPKTSQAQLDRMRKSEIPHKITVKDGEVTSHYNNGTKVVSDGQGKFKSVTYPNGQQYQFQHDADGKLSGVVAPDGTVYQKRGDQGVGLDGSRADKWTMYGGRPPREMGTFAGSFNVKDNGTVEKRQLDGNYTLNEANGRTIVHNRAGQPFRITEANGQTWVADRIPGTGNQPDKANQRVWKLQGNEKVSFTGEHKLQPDGSVAFKTAEGMRKRNDDGSISKFNDKGVETERTSENGASIKRDAATGLPTQFKDVDGNVRDITWGKTKDGQPIITEVKTTGKDGKVSVEQLDSKGMLREVKDPNAKEEKDKFGNAVEYGNDGSRTVTSVDGDGKPTGIAKRNLDGSEFRYDAAGKFTGATIRKPDGYLLEANAQGKAVEVKQPVPGTNPTEYKTVALQNQTDGSLRALNEAGKPEGARVVVTDTGIAKEKPNGGFTSERPGGAIDHLDPNGRFEYSTDKDGKRLRVADSRGGEANFVYENGKLARVDYRGPDRDGVLTTKADGTTGNLELLLGDGRKETYDSQGRLMKKSFIDGSSMEFNPATGVPTKTKDVYGTERTFEPAGKWPPESVAVKKTGQDQPTVTEKFDPETKRLREYDATTKKFGAAVSYDANTGTRTAVTVETGKPSKVVEERLDGARFEQVGEKLTATNKFAADRMRAEQGKAPDADSRPPIRPDLNDAMAAAEKAMNERPTIPREIQGTAEKGVDQRTGDGATLKHQRDALLAHADTLPEPQKTDIKVNLALFEARAAREKMSEATMAKTLFQANRMLEANPAELKNGIDRADFARTAQGYMQGIAKPGDTNQGFHLSCNTSAPREALLTEKPWVAGQAVADAMMSKDGTYKAPDGQMVRLDMASLKSDREARVSSQDPANAALNGFRTGFGQSLDHVFANYAHNLQWKRENGLPPDHVVAKAMYYQVQPTLGRKDTGERFEYPGTRAWNHSGVRTDQIADIATGFLGRNNVITNADTDPNSKRTIQIKTPEQLQTALDEGLKKGPMTLLVHDGHPLIQDGGRSGGMHVFSVVNSKTIDGKLYYSISDQAGTASDKWVSARDLFETTKRPDNAGRFPPVQDKVYYDRKDANGAIIYGKDGKPETTEAPSSPVPRTPVVTPNRQASNEYRLPWQTDKSVLVAGAVDRQAVVDSFMPPADTRSSMDRAKEVFGDKVPGAGNKAAEQYFNAKTDSERQAALQTLAQQAAGDNKQAQELVKQLAIVDAAISLKHAEGGTGPRGEDARNQAVMRLAALGASDYLNKWAGEDQGKKDLVADAQTRIEHLRNAGDGDQSQQLVAQARAEFLRQSATPEGRQGALKAIDRLQANELLNNGALNPELEKQKEELKAATPETLQALKLERPDIAYRLNPAEIPDLRREVEKSGDAQALARFDAAVRDGQNEAAKQKQEVADAQSRFLDRASSPEARQDAIKSLEKTLQSEYGPERQKLQDTIASTKALGAAVDLVQAKDSTAASKALTQLTNLATGQPPNLAAQVMFNQLGGAKGVEALQRQLSAQDAPSRTQAMQEMKAKLEGNVNQMMTQQRVDRLTESFKSNVKPEDMEKAEKALVDELRAAEKDVRDGKPGAKEAYNSVLNAADWAGSYRAITDINNAKQGDAASGQRGVDAVNRLLAQASIGNPYARAALDTIITGGGAGRPAGDRALPELSLKGLGDKEMPVRLAAAQEIQREVTSAGGVIYGDRAQAVANALANAKTQGADVLASHLEKTLDSALAGRDKEITVDAMSRTIIDGVKGSSVLADRYMQHANQRQLERDLPEMTQRAAAGDPTALRVVANIAGGAGTNPQLAAKAQASLVEMAKNEDTRGKVMDALKEALPNDKGGALSALSEIGREHPEVALAVQQTLHSALTSSNPLMRNAAISAMMKNAGNWDEKDVRAVASNMTPDMVRALQGLPDKVLDKHRDALVAGLKDPITSDKYDATKREQAMHAAVALGGKEALEKMGLNVEPNAQDKTKFSVTDRDGTTYQIKDRKVESFARKDTSSVTNSYDAAGKLTGSVEKAQSGNTITRDASNNITLVEKPTGEKLRVDYKDGVASRVTDNSGNQWESTDGKNWKQKFTGETMTGKLTANADGSFDIAGKDKVFTQRLDGTSTIVDKKRNEKTEVANDGSSVTTDAAGHVVRTRTSDGFVNEYKWTGDQLTGVKDRSGEWSTKDGKTWSKAGGGEPPWPGKIWVTADGAQHEQRDGGAHKAKTLQGATLTYDDKGRITEVKNAYGEVTGYGYTGDSKTPSSFRKGKDEWKTENGSDWQLYRDGKMYTEPGGKFKGSLQLNDNGSRIWRDDKNRVTEAVDVRGRTAKFGYTGDSKDPSTETDYSGEWRTKDGVNWTKYEDGKPTTSTYTGTVKVNHETGEYTDKGQTSGTTRTVKMDNTISWTDKSGNVYQRQNASGFEELKYGADGSLTGRILHSEGAKASLDVNGRVKEVTMPNGDVRKFEWSDDGKLLKISEPDGREYTSKDGHVFTTKGTGDVISGKPFVKPNGDYGWQTDNNKLIERKKEGIVVSDIAGSRLGNDDGSIVTRNASQNIVAAQDANGINRAIERNAANEPTKVTIGNRVFTKNDKGEWVSPGMPPMKGTFDFDEKGNFIFKDAATNLTSISKTDGSTVVKDASGKVLEMVTPDGKSTRFGYGQDNQISTMRMPDGSTFVKMPGSPERWRKDGTSEIFKGTRSVDADGNVHLKEDGKPEVVHRTDGFARHDLGNGKFQLRKDNTDGSYVIKNDQNQVTETRDAKGVVRKHDPAELAKRNAVVTPEGDYVERNGNKETIYKLDGSKLEAENGRFTMITPAKGPATQVGYGADGKPNKLTPVPGDGSYSATEDGVTWKQYTADGKLKPGTEVKQTVAIGRDGSIQKDFGDRKERSFTDGSKLVTEPDGRLRSETLKDGTEKNYRYKADKSLASIEEKRPDGTRVVSDDRGRITEVEKNGVKRTFEYDEYGRISKFTDGGKTFELANPNDVNSLVYRNAANHNERFAAAITATADGTRFVYGGGREMFDRLDGKQVYQNADGSIFTRRASDGKLTETVSPKGERTQYEYGITDVHGNEDQISAVKYGDPPNQTTWRTTNGIYWNRDGGNPNDIWVGFKRLTQNDVPGSDWNKAGLLIETDQYGLRTYRGGNGDSWKPEQTKPDDTARAVWKALDDNYWDSSQAAAVQAVLQDKTADDIYLADRRFNRIRDSKGNPLHKSGSMEGAIKDHIGEGHDLTRSLQYLHRRSTNSQDLAHEQNAERLHVNLEERSQWYYGRSDSAIDRDTRAILGPMSDHDLRRTHDIYLKRFGVGLKDDFTTGQYSKYQVQRSEFHREAIKLYSDAGVDKRTAEAQANLMHVAVRSGSVDYIRESMQKDRARDDGRALFRSQGGLASIEDRFTYQDAEGGTRRDDMAIREATDYAMKGELRASTQIMKATGIMSNNQENVNVALERLTPEQRAQYFDGKKLAGDVAAGRTTVADINNDKVKKEAYEYYQDLKQAIDGLHYFSKDRHRIDYEDKVRTEGGSMIARDVAPHGGFWKADSNQENLSSLENITRENFDRLMLNAPAGGVNSDGTMQSYQDAVRQAIALNYGKPETWEKGRRATELLEKKIAKGNEINTATDQVLDAMRAGQPIPPASLAKMREEIPALKSMSDKQFNDLVRGYELNRSAERGAMTAMSMMRGRQLEAAITAGQDTKASVDAGKAISDRLAGLTGDERKKAEAALSPAQQEQLRDFRDVQNLRDAEAGKLTRDEKEARLDSINRGRELNSAMKAADQIEQGAKEGKALAERIDKLPTANARMLEEQKWSPEQREMLAAHRDLERHKGGEAKLSTQEKEDLARYRAGEAGKVSADEQRQMAASREDKVLRPFLDGRDVARRFEEIARDPNRTNVQKLADDKIARESISQADYTSMDAYNQKLYESVRDSQRRSLEETLTDAKSIFGHDYKAMFEGIQNMTPDERKRYAAGQTNIDTLVKNVIGKEGPIAEVAASLLKQVKDNPDKRPEMTLTDRLNVAAGLERPTKADVVRMISEGTRDPAVRQQLANDEAFKRAATAALKKSMAGQDELQRDPKGEKAFDRLAKPLLETGTLPIDTWKEVHTNRGTGQLNKEAFFRDAVLNASPEALKALKADASERNKLMAILGDESLRDKKLGPDQRPASEKARDAGLRQVAGNIIEQGETRQEDRLRAYVVDGGVTKDQARAILDGLPDKAARIANAGAFSEKYAFPDPEKKEKDTFRGDLRQQMMGKVTADSDKLDMLRLTRTDDWSTRMEHNFAVEKAARADGFGRSLLLRWDASAAQLEEALARYGAGVAALPDGVNMSDHMTKQYNLGVDEALRNKRDSKAALGDAIADGVITVVAIATIPVSGGTSLALLTVAAGGTQLAAKAAFMGNDFDGTVKGIGAELASGTVKFWINRIPTPGLGAAGSKIADLSASAAMKAAGLVGLSESKQLAVKAVTQALVAQGIKEGGHITKDAYEQYSKALMARGLTQAESLALKGTIQKAVEETLKAEAKSAFKAAYTVARNEITGALLSGGTAGVASVAGHVAESTIRGRELRADELWQAGSTGFMFGVGAHGVLSTGGGMMRRLGGTHEPVLRAGEAPSAGRANVRPDPTFEPVTGGNTRIAEPGQKVFVDNGQVVGRADSQVVAAGPRAEVRMQEGRAAIHDGARFDAAGKSQVSVHEGSVGTIRENARVDIHDTGHGVIPEHATATGGTPDGPQVKLRDQASVEVHSRSSIKTEGLETVVDVRRGATDVDITMEGGTAKFSEGGSGRVTGNGTVEISGNSKVEVNVPEGQTMRVVLKDGADFKIAEGSKGKVEVVREAQPVPASGTATRPKTGNPQTDSTNLPTDRVHDPKPPRVTDEVAGRLTQMNPEITNPAALKDLNQRVASAMDNPIWKEDLRPSVQRSAEIDKQIKARQEDLSDGFMRDPRERNPEIQRKMADARKEIETLKAEQAKLNENVDKVAAARAEQLDQVFNQWLKEHGLEGTKIKFMDKQVDGAAGVYRSGEGRIEIGRDALLSSDLAGDRAKLVLHEYIHHQQDIALARKAIHDSGANAKPDVVKAEYKAKTGRELSDDLYKQAAEVHSKRQWTSADDANAVALQKAVKSYDADFKKIEQLTASGQKLVPHMEALKGAPESAVQDIFGRLKDAERPGSPHKGLKYELWEGGVMPKEVKAQYDAWKAKSPDFDPNVAATKLYDNLQVRMLKNNMEIEAVSARYFKNEMELQSYGGEQIFDRHVKPGEALRRTGDGPDVPTRTMADVAPTTGNNPPTVSTPGASTAPKGTVGGVDIPVGEPISIGRRDPSSRAKVQLDGMPDTVGRNHAEVMIDPKGGRWVRDNGSANGTHIVTADGVKTVKGDWAQLKPGDRLFLGTKEVQFGVKPTNQLEIGGKPVELGIGESRPLKRDDFPQPHSRISGEHGAIGMDEKGIYIVDGVKQPNGGIKPSTNGTYVNGEKIPSGQKVYLKEGDLVSVGAPHGQPGFQPIEVTPPGGRGRISAAGDDGGGFLLPNPKLQVGLRNIEMKPGTEIEFGRIDFNGEPERMSARHGRVGVEADGRVYIVDGIKQPDGSLQPSKNGTWVNGERLKPGEKYYLSPSDKVHAGPAKVELFGSDKWNPRPPKDPAVFQQAGDQANHFGQYMELRGKVKDGFSDAGKYTEYNSRNSVVDARYYRENLVVDRANDPVLAATVAEAKQKFGHLPPAERAEALAKFVKDKLEPPHGLTGEALNDWIHDFGTAHSGQKVPLGRYIQEGKGVCIHQATLMKVLGDELGLDITLVRGATGGPRSTTMDHAWTHVHLPGQKEPLIFDPRGEIYGARYSDVPSYRRGGDVVAAENGRPNPAEPHYDGAPADRQPGPRMQRPANDPNEMAAPNAIERGKLRTSVDAAVQTIDQDLAHLPAKTRAQVKVAMQEAINDVDAAGKLPPGTARTKALDAAATRLRAMDDAATALKTHKGLSSDMVNDAFRAFEHARGTDLDVPMRQLLHPDVKPEAVRFYADKIDEVSYHTKANNVPRDGHIYEDKIGARIQEALASNKGAEGLPEGWIFVPAAHNSAADAIKIDGLLINTRGKPPEMVPIDFAASIKRRQEKLGEGVRWAAHFDKDLSDTALRQELKDFLDKGQGAHPITRLPVSHFMDASGSTFPSFRSVVSEAEANALGVRTTDKELGVVRARMQALETDPSTPFAQQEVYKYFRERARASQPQRDTEFALGVAHGDPLGRAIEVQAARDKGFQIPESKVKPAVKNDLEGFPYIEFPLAGAHRVNGENITSIRVYENGAVAGYAGMKQPKPGSKGGPQENLVELGHISQVLERTRGNLSPAGQTQLDSILGGVPPRFSIAGQKPDAILSSNPALRAVAEASGASGVLKDHATSALNQPGIRAELQQAIARSEVKPFTGPKANEEMAALVAATDEARTSLKKPDLSIPDVQELQRLRDTYNAKTWSDAAQLKERMSDPALASIPDEAARAEMAKKVDTVLKDGRGITTVADAKKLVDDLGPDFNLRNHLYDINDAITKKKVAPMSDTDKLDFARVMEDARSGSAGIGGNSLPVERIKEIHVVKEQLPKGTSWKDAQTISKMQPAEQAMAIGVLQEFGPMTPVEALNKAKELGKTQVDVRNALDEISDIRRQRPDLDAKDAQKVRNVLPEIEKVASSKDGLEVLNNVPLSPAEKLEVAVNITKGGSTLDDELLRLSFLDRK